MWWSTLICQVFPGLAEKLTPVCLFDLYCQWVLNWVSRMSNVKHIKIQGLLLRFIVDRGTSYAWNKKLLDLPTEEEMTTFLSNVISGLLSFRGNSSSTSLCKGYVFNEWGKYWNHHLVTKLIERWDASGQALSNSAQKGINWSIIIHSLCSN